jgi:hypothetical protein
MEDIDVLNKEGEASLLTLDALERGGHEHKMPTLAPLLAERETEWRTWSEERLKMLFAA